MPFPGFPLDTSRSNSTPMTDRHPLDHVEERTALNDVQAQIDAINTNLLARSIFQAKGDTLSATAINTPVRMAVPADYGLMVSDSAEPDGWRAVGNAFRVEGAPAWTVAPNLPLALFEVSRMPLPVGTARTGQVVLHVSVVNNTGGALPNGASIGTLALGYRPIFSVRCPGFNASAAVNTLMFNVQTNGTVFISVGGGWTAPANGQTSGFSISYSTNDA